MRGASRWLVGLVLGLACGPTDGELATAGDDSMPTEDPRERCYPTVSFADPRLEHQVRGRIGAPDVPLTVAEIEALWGDDWTHGEGALLNGADFSGIRDLEGIQCLPLESFTCARCPVTDLEPLAGLPALRGFSITGADAPELDPLARIPTLESVQLPEAGIVDASPLLGASADLPALRKVGLVGNQLRDIQGVAALPRLESLYLGGNLIETAPEVAGMPALEVLDLSDNPISDLTPLAGHTGLRALRLRGARVASLDALASTTLVELTAEEGELASADGLPPTIEVANLEGNQLRAPPRGALPALRRLELGANQIASLAELEAPAIERLGLAQNELTTLTGLSAPQLDNLVVDFNPLTSFAGLDAPALRGLSARHCDLASLEGLDSVSALQHARLDGNELTELVGLPLAEGAELDASVNAISDLSGLNGAPPLYSLNLSANPLTDLSTLPALVVTRELFLDDADLVSLAGIEAITLTTEEPVDVSVRANPLTDLSPLTAFLVEGRELRIDASSTAVSDLSQALLFDPTASLRLRDCAITDAAALADPALDLSVLDLAGNAITTLPDMDGVELAIGELDLSDNLIGSLGPFAGATIDGERSVNLRGNAITSLDGLEAVDFLYARRLDLGANAITDTSALSELSPGVGTIEELYLDANMIAELPAYDGWTVRSLVLSDNPLVSVGPLGGQVEALRCERCGLASLDGIVEALPGLHELMLSDNPLATLAGIEGAASLKVLELDHIATADFSPLVMLADELVSVSAVGNGIADAAPFVDLSAAQLDDNLIADLSPLAVLSPPSSEFFLPGNPIDLDLSLAAIYDRCRHADITVEWDDWSCQRPDYASRPPAPPTGSPSPASTRRR